MLITFFSLALLLSSVSCERLPSVTAASASPASVTSSHFPAPTTAPLVERCDGGNCEFGGSGTTLQAATVTSTILSTTSVPCYITTYITNSETVTETIYSTETITSTVTKEGTVFIVQYSPTPVLMSTPVTSIIQITNTWWSYWMTTEGSAYQVTSSGGDKTYGGEANTWTSGSGLGSGSGSGWSSAGGGAGAGTGDAWTHVNNAVDATLAPQGGVGVTVASNNGWGNGGSTGSTWNGNGSPTGGFVNWNDASRRIQLTGCESAIGLGMVLQLLVWRVYRHLA